MNEHRQALAAELYACCRLSGEFTLRSGRTASHYFDKYQFESDPKLLAAVAAEMKALIPAGVDLLAGLEMGGIAVVTALSAASEMPAVFVRKTPKRYGTNRLAEGPPIGGRVLLIVEDVATSGGQIIDSAAALRELGAEVSAAVCVIDRGEGAAEALAAAGITLRSLFCASEIEAPA